MTLEIDRKILWFKTKQIWFAEDPYEIHGYDSVSFYSTKNKVDIDKYKMQEFTTLVVNLEKSLDEIWGSFDKKSCRYEINKALKSNIEIKINEGYSSFIKLNQEFRKQKGISPFNINENEMRRYGILFTAKVDDELIAGQYYIHDDENIRWLLGASKRLQVSKEKTKLIGCANRLIIWKAITYAKEKGIKLFDLGGYYTGEKFDEQKEKINLFKESFGGEIKTLYNYTTDYSVIFKVIKNIYKVVY